MYKLLLIICIVWLLASCKKDTGYDSRGVVGHWKLFYEVNGLTGRAIDLPKDTTYFLFLNANHTYISLKNSEIQKQGTYTLGKVKSIFDGSMVDAIGFDVSNSNDLFELVKVDKDTLSFTINAYDAPSVGYIRVK